MSSRIDYVFVSGGLISSIMGAEMGPRLLADHSLQILELSCQLGREKGVRWRLPGGFLDDEIQCEKVIERSKQYFDENKAGETSHADGKLLKLQSGVG